MLIPLNKVLAMRLQYVTMTADARAAKGYAGHEPVLRADAAEVLNWAFRPYPIDPADLIITCCSLEGDDNDLRLVFRATWAPSMDEILLVDGYSTYPYHLPSPQNTVTTSSGVRTLRYFLDGFDTDARRYVFAAEAKEKLLA